MFTRSILPFETDMFGCLKPSQLLRYCMHSCSAQQYEEDLGEALERAAPNSAWMLARFCLTQEQPIKAGDKLVFNCLPRAVDGAVYIRHIHVLRDDCEVALCSIVWMLVDMESRRILRAKTVEQQLQDVSPAISLPSLPRLTLPYELSEHSRHSVRRSDCDSNGHFSSANYVDLLCDAFGFWKNGASIMKSIQIDYHSEFLPEETVSLSCDTVENEMFVQGVHDDGRKGFSASMKTERICLDNI